MRLLSNMKMRIFLAGIMVQISSKCLKIFEKIRRVPKLEGCAFANFGNSSGTEGELRL